jgi:hypothetical protein
MNDDCTLACSICGSHIDDNCGCHKKLNALFVEKDGTYFNNEIIEPFDVERNAFTVNNGLPAICHPPCERWGRYWPGQPGTKNRKKLGDDKGCFAFALWYVRTYGGVIEHPEASTRMGLLRTQQTT